MADELLRDHVLHRADADDDLSEDARSVVLEAWRDLPAEAPLTLAMARLDAEVETLARHQAAASTAPAVDAVEEACAALLSAANAQAAAERSADALSADRVQFLETSLEFHDRHGTQPCPVCAKTTLDDEWVVLARAALAAEQDAASALRVARSGAHRARSALTALIRAVEAPSPEDAGLAEIVAARNAHASFATLSADDDSALADRVARELPDLRTAYDALLEASTHRLGVAREAQTWLRAFGEGDG
jgi:hypothetical protein